MKNNINLVFMGGFTFPNGMAGTKRVQNIIDSLKQFSDVAVRVILQRQSSQDNTLSGAHNGTPYETVMGDLFRAKSLLGMPLLYLKTCTVLRKAFRPDCKNIIYLYGPLLHENVVPLSYARHIGYKIVIDVVEDYDLLQDIANSYYPVIKFYFMTRFSSRISKLSAGIIVISSHLERKYQALVRGKVPVHYLPISVNMDRFPVVPARTKSMVTLLYAGTFAAKDGLPVLLDAFDWLAARYDNVCLVLTGKGDRDSMDKFFARMERSPHKDRIDYQGYLGENEYYTTVNDAVISCMTRVDHAFAHAGFPFKLGEFLAAGKPVIASRISDIDRFLKHGENAMLVRPGDSAEICEAAEFLINNPDIAAAIGKRGRETARKFFDYKEQGRSLLAFLENL